MAAATFRDFLRESLRRAFTRANQPSRYNTDGFSSPLSFCFYISDYPGVYVGQNIGALIFPNCYQPVVFLGGGHVHIWRSLRQWCWALLPGTHVKRHSGTVWHRGTYSPTIPPPPHISYRSSSNNSLSRISPMVQGPTKWTIYTAS